ncbi:hypothetical protein BJV77DRAFT_1047383, partial [Russula vinacea]
APICVRESVERVAAEESNDNPFGRSTPCNERRRRSGAWSVSGSTRLISSAVVDKRERSRSFGKRLLIG